MNCCGISFGQWREVRVGRSPDWDRPPHYQRQSGLRRIRTATLRRLEEEQREFRSARLRVAKDRAEFDQFMVARGTPLEPAQPQT